MVPDPIPGTPTWKYSESRAMPGARRRSKAFPGTCCPWLSALGARDSSWVTWSGARCAKAGADRGQSPSCHESQQVSRRRPHRRDGDSPLITRHAPIDRVFHWITALAVLLLMASAFLPILGLKFSWVPLHWITGRGADRRRAVPPGARQFLPAPALHVDLARATFAMPAPGAARPSTRWRRSSCTRCWEPRCWSRRSPA